MTPTETTTRPSNNIITRRKMLQSVAVVSAIVILPASIVSQAAGLVPVSTTNFDTSPQAGAIDLGNTTTAEQHALIKRSFDAILRLSPEQQQQWIAGLRASSPKFGPMADIYQEHVNAHRKNAEI